MGLRGHGVRKAARFSPPNAFVASPAPTYDMKPVPAGARIEVVRRGGRGRVSVRGAYGAHVQQGECGGIRPWRAGTYRHREDPVQPSTGPAHANPENEVWLGFTTGAHGAGRRPRWQSREFRSGEAWSVVLHGRPGGAGARIGCFTVSFEQVAFGRVPVESMGVKPLVHHGRARCGAATALAEPGVQVRRGVVRRVAR
ncbi:hypothetical protein ACFV90_29930, partial [Streptomyces sp. NPDC059904]|uniref:hypothetical protein n=1 Tax=Streptomyces sp. NPDC059904 TaxID=3346996 RepID=UPI00365CF6FD